MFCPGNLLAGMTGQATIPYTIRWAAVDSGSNRIPECPYEPPGRSVIGKSAIS